MTSANHAADEAERIDALAALKVLGTPPEAALDDLTALAAHVCQTPIAVVALTDGTRQWFKTQVEIDLSVISLDAAFHAHTNLAADVFVVEDAQTDERLANAPSVTGQPGIRFYAGVPLKTVEGPAIGTLCVLDRVPRKLLPEQETALRLISKQVMNQLTLHGALAELQATIEDRPSGKAESPCDEELRKSTTRLDREIGKRLLAEKALRDSEDRFRLLVGGVQEYGMFLLDRVGNVLSWNAGARRIKGYEAEQIIGRHFSIFYPPQDLAAGKPEMELKLAAEKGLCEDEGWRVRADGTHFWASVLITSLKDSSGRLRGFSKLIRDISERRVLQEEVVTFFDGSADLQGIAGADGLFKKINPAFGKILGYTDAEILARPYLDFVHPDDRAATAAAAAQVEAGLINEFENRYRCKSGSYRWIRWTVSLSSDARRLFASGRGCDRPQAQRNCGVRERGKASRDLRNRGRRSHHH